MKKPQDTKVLVSRRASSKAVGIRDIQVVRGPKGYRSLLVKIEPHFTIVVNGGRKPTVTLMYSHHGVTLDTFDLNCTFEQVIDHLRQKFPQLRID
jgi:hypothetical protein